MNTLPRWISFASFAAVLVLATTGAQAFTDSNAELKEAAADKADRVVIVGKATRPVQTAWVPASPKALDSFKPVLPPERALGLAMAEAHAQSQSQKLAKADVVTTVAKR